MLAACPSVTLQRFFDDEQFSGQITRVSMELSNLLVSWVITYLRDLQPTCIGVIIHLLSTHGHPSSIIPKPELKGFWGDSLTKPPFKVTSAEFVIIGQEQSRFCGKISCFSLCKKYNISQPLFS